MDGFAYDMLDLLVPAPHFPPSTPDKQPPTPRVSRSSNGNNDDDDFPVCLPSPDVTFIQGDEELGASTSTSMSTRAIAAASRSISVSGVLHSAPPLDVSQPPPSPCPFTLPLPSAPPVAVATSLPSFTVSSRELPVGMFEFLSRPETTRQMELLQASLYIKLTFDEKHLYVTHDARLTADPVFEHLLERFHNASFENAMRISMLRAMCPHSVSARFSVAQTSLISFYAHQILRDSGIVDIVIEPAGQISWYGNAHTIAQANLIVDTIMYTVLGDEAGKEVHDIIAKGCSLHTHGRLDSQEGGSPQKVGNGSGYDQFNLPVTPMRKRYKERQIIFVKAAYAPRLIGSRGANKKKIESANNCCIILHTENKNDSMEFPVEIFAMSEEDCVKAKECIEQFLNDPASASTSNSTDRPSRQNTYVPIIRLEHSPRKQSNLEKAISL